MNHPQRYAIFFSAGLGDALLMIPLLKRLKKQTTEITGIVTSPYIPTDFLTVTGLVEHWLDLKDGNITLDLTKFCRFDHAILNQFANTRRNIISARLMAKKLIVSKPQDGLGILEVLVSKSVSPASGIHDAAQNLKLCESTTSIVIQDFECEVILPPPAIPIQKKYLAVQLSTGNDRHRYKNWPQPYWEKLISLLLITYPDFDIVLMGDSNETSYSSQLLEQMPSIKLINTAGKTSLIDAAAILQHARLFIGLDGGLMHLAATVGTPTITVWGASNPNLYGYAQFDATKHTTLHANLKCAPCNAWINPNHTRVTQPNACPDFACMSAVTPDMVFEAVKSKLAVA